MENFILYPCLLLMGARNCYAHGMFFPDLFAQISGKECDELFCRASAFPLDVFSGIGWLFSLGILIIGLLFFLGRHYRQKNDEKRIYKEQMKLSLKIIRQSHTSLALLQNMLSRIMTDELPESLTGEVKQMMEYTNFAVERYRYAMALSEIDKEMQPGFSKIECELLTYIVSITNYCRAYAYDREIELTVDTDVEYTSCWINEITMTSALQCLLEEIIDIAPLKGSINLTLSCSEQEWTLEIVSRNTLAGEKHWNCSGILWRPALLRYENMPLIKKIISLHGGDLNIDEQKETVVAKISVPLSGSIQAKGYVAKMVNNINEKLSPQKKKMPVDTKKDVHVLLVISDKELGGYLGQVLSESYQITTIQDAESVLDFFKEGTTDVLVIDEFVNGMRGSDICSRLRLEHSISYIPTILLAEWSSYEKYVTHFLGGANKLHRRIVDIAKLKADIQILIANRIAQREWMMKLAKDNCIGALPTIETKQDEKDDFMERIDKCLEEHLSTESYTIDLLSADMGVSRSSLYKKIKTYTGMSPDYYMYAYKMYKAKMLLIVQGETVTGIAITLGYCDARYFGKRFKNFYGIPPTLYRKKVLGVGLS